jgi:hypothetical protein
MARANCTDARPTPPTEHQDCLAGSQSGALARRNPSRVLDKAQRCGLEKRHSVRGISSSSRKNSGMSFRQTGHIQMPQDRLRFEHHVFTPHNGEADPFAEPRIRDREGCGPLDRVVTRRQRFDAPGWTL